MIAWVIALFAVSVFVVYVLIAALCATADGKDRAMGAKR